MVTPKEAVIGAGPGTQIAGEPRGTARKAVRGHVEMAPDTAPLRCPLLAPEDRDSGVKFAEKRGLP